MPKIIVYNGNNSENYEFREGALLIDVLRNCGFLIDAPCGGHGQCKKCRVQITINGEKEEVLSCQTRLFCDCEVILTGNNNFIFNKANTSINQNNLNNTDDFLVAIDLGTTTLEISLLNSSTKEKIDSISEWNWQRTYGADVISRIDFCINNSNGLETLSNLVRKQISKLIDELCQRNGIDKKCINQGFLAGNTVMQHIFAKIDPQSIALAPFIPQSYFEKNETHYLDDIPLHLAPCISGYVGGDIVSGLSVLDLNQKTMLFIDIGTNGEMALGNKDNLCTCSVACGPAFEGAEISCGMHAVSGAINKVWIENNKLAYDVIDQTLAKGVCGSGLVDLVSCLLDLGYLDESGYLEEDINENIWINQKDIRKLQLAKAAISAGIKTLMKEENLSFDDIDTVYIAGSFGNHLNIQNAAKIGMIPYELVNKVKLCGNTCLIAGEQIVVNKERINELNKIKESCKYIELSTSADFTDYFVDEMSFPEV